MKRIIILFLSIGAFLFAQVPRTLNYQGILSDQNGTIVTDNDYTLTFKLYAESAGGSPIWQEQQTVSVSKGIFSVILGKIVPLTPLFDNQYYLGISIGVEAELQPRIEVTSSAYSLMSTSIIDNSITTAKLVDGAVTQTKLAPGLSLPPGGSAGGDLSGTFPNPVVNKLQGRTVSSTAPTSGQVLSWNGTQWVPANTTTGIGGTGTANTIAKFSDSQTLANSVITESSGRIGIAHANPQWSLDLGESSLSSNYLRINGTSAAGILFGDPEDSFAGSIVYRHDEDFMFFATKSTSYTEQMRITKIGRLGVGTQIPLARIHSFTHGQYAGIFESDSASSSTVVLKGKFTGSGNYDAKGVSGECIPADGYGYGGYFTGGYIGVRGISSSNLAGTIVGMYGSATGAGGIRYGVYGSASGGTTNYSVYSSGNLHYTGTLTGPSDGKLKNNIVSVGSTIDKIKQLQPRTFNYSTDGLYSKMNLPSGTHYGLVAQELEQVYPELVHDAAYSSDERGIEEIKYKSVAMIEMIPILIQGLKEQQQMIEDLKREIESLKGR